MNLLKSVCLMVLGTALTTASGQTLKKENSFRSKKKNPAPHSRVLFSNDYTFSVSTGSYSNLSSGTSLNNNLLWDDPEYVVPIGFTFQLFDQNITDLYFGLGTGGLVSTIPDSNYYADYIILPFEADLIDRGDISGTSQSPISYQLSGSPGSRIFKLEWKNAGFYEEGSSLNTLNDFVNFQLWLYEGSNNIEFHFGSSMIMNPSIDYSGESGAICGLTDYNLTNSYILFGNSAFPAVSDSAVYLSGTPASGRIYKFTKTLTGIDLIKSDKTETKIYPNPFRNNTTIKINKDRINNAELKVIDIYGRVVKTLVNIQSNEIRFESGDLSKGIYFFQLMENDNTIASGKLLVE